MDSDTRLARRERFELIGDGALLTAAVLAALIGVLLLITQGVGDREVPIAIQIVASLSTLVGGAAGPVLAWRLHGRTIDIPAIIGGLLAMPASGAVFWMFVGFSTLLGKVLARVNDADWFGPLVAAGLVAALFLGFLVWLAIIAARDLARGTPAHRPLDLVRLASALVVVVFSAVVIVRAFGAAGGEIVEAIAFMLVGAVTGALVVALADVMTRLIRPRTEPPAEAA